MVYNSSLRFYSTPSSVEPGSTVRQPVTLDE